MEKRLVNYAIARAESINYSRVLLSIFSDVKDYLEMHRIKALIIGVSGGLDSGLNAAILKPICEVLNIPLIGRYIHIESNKEEEKQRADAIGKAFCTDYKSVDLTELYHQSIPLYEEKQVLEPTFQDKIRRGNIKARMRMIYLYNLAQENGGIVVDNDNKTERQLGFWTLNGDVGDITPLASLYKTEVFELAKYLVEFTRNEMPNSENEIEALEAVINAVPTDGLGITSSDVEQFGVNSYAEVDDILITNKYMPNSEKYLYGKYGEEAVDKVLNRQKNSEFKRHHPHRVEIETA